MNMEEKNVYSQLITQGVLQLLTYMRSRQACVFKLLPPADAKDDCAQGLGIWLAYMRIGSAEILNYDDATPADVYVTVCAVNDNVRDVRFVEVDDKHVCISIHGIPDTQADHAALYYLLMRTVSNDFRHHASRLLNAMVV